MIEALRKLKHIIRDLISVYTPWGSFHHGENEIRTQYYSSQNRRLGINKTTIIVMFDGRFVHGGLSDRLRGMATIYGFCKKKNVPFYINHTYPFLLQDYLLPNEYNWITNLSDISYNENEARPICLNSFALPNKYHSVFMNVAFNRNKGKQLHLYTSTRFLDCDYAQNFNELFQPSPRLQQAIDENLKRIGKPYVAMVFRFQQLLGDFKEDGYKILAPDEQIALIKKCVDKVEELHYRLFPNEQILVTADSVTFLNEINKLDYVYIIPGRVVHMDHTANASFDVYLKSFVDMFMLSKAKKVFLLQTGDMYHSGFAKRSAMINNVPYEEIIF